MKRSRLLSILFLCSFSSLAYEVLLTRIFSIALGYHFAFMIVSIAMLGLGASGTALSLFPRLKEPSRLTLYVLFVGAGISVSYLLANPIPFDPITLSWSWTPLLCVGAYYILLSSPFFFTGLVIGTSFSSFSEDTNLLYGADLLGAGMGSVAVLVLLFGVAPDRAVMAISSLALCATFLAGNKTKGAIALIVLVANVLILAFQPGFARMKISPYKELEMAQRYPGARKLKTIDTPFARIDLFRSPAVRFAPGLSFQYLESLPEQMGFTVDGGEMNAVTSADDPSKLAFLEFLPAALPYAIGPRERVVVLDPKGGLHVLLALRHGSKEVFKVESRPFLLEVLHNELGAFSGGIYGEKAWSKLGRSWLRREKKGFDLIDMSLTGAIPSGSFGMAEDYRYTVEAFREYLEHLTPQGVLSINLFILPPPRTELRLLNSLREALKEIGVVDPGLHLAAIRGWGTLCMVAKRSPLNSTEISLIKGFSKERRFDIVYYPGVKGEETNLHVRTPSPDHFLAFQQLLDPARRKDFIKSYLFDIEPVRDSNPFPHLYLKLKNIFKIYRAMGGKWQYFIGEGYLLPIVFIQVSLLSLALVFIPFWVAKRAKPSNFATKPRCRTFPARTLGYFALIGLGFMFVEVALIQRFILPYENPPLAVALVLTSLLFGSGLGSLLGHRWETHRGSYLVAVLSFLVIAYDLVLPSFLRSISSMTMPLRVALGFLTLLPLGLLMGNPFPFGLRNLGQADPALIPWAWAVNGCFSVLAPLIAMMMAMGAGFASVLWAGAGCYLLAFLLFSQVGLTRRRVVWREEPSLREGQSFDQGVQKAIKFDLLHRERETAHEILLSNGFI
jgi:hypothetical protein